MNRRFTILAALFATSVALSASCGEASLKLTKPTPTPDDSVDCTFSVGVMEAFLTEDCGNSGCHGPNPNAQLQLVNSDVDIDVIYQLLMDSGGTLQRLSNCASEPAECAEDPSGAGCCVRDVRPGFPERSLLLTKPYAESTEGHGGGKQFSTDDEPGYRSIECWIENGAEND